ncbi:DUF1152 domain-containing protein [Thermoleophilia bacterium SCSIO 60948]|nr:DUF1152 domain-containing protein [Thermoleophilia bacterium SCSIO 60948]
MIGIGGGGDVVGSLAIARLCESLGTPATLGGVSWERLPIDPRPGPRPVEEIVGGRPLGERAVLADAATTTVDAIPFSESRVAGALGVPTLLIDPNGGPLGVADALAAAAGELGADLVVLTDIGGDAIADGTERGLASPLCDAVMLAAALELERRGGPATLGAILGAGCDGELEPEEVLDRVAALGRVGSWIGSWSMGPEVADEIESVAASTGTEASLGVVRCARGESGEVPIRGGRRKVRLGPAGAIGFFFDVPRAAKAGELPLVSAVEGTADLASAQDSLAAIGVRTELDWELENAG